MGKCLSKSIGIVSLFASIAIFAMIACGGGGGAGVDGITTTSQTSLPVLPSNIDNQNLVDSAPFDLEVPSLLGDTSKTYAYAFVSGPEGMSINSDGVLKWIPVKTGIHKIYFYFFLAISKLPRPKIISVAGSGVVTK